jgi:hypothetical protein
VTSISSVTDYLILRACISDHYEVERRPFGVFQDGLDIEGQCLQYGGNIVFVLWRIPRFSNFIFTLNFAIVGPGRSMSFVILYWEYIVIKKYKIYPLSCKLKLDFYK